MRKVTRYQCEYCGELFNTEIECFNHERRHEQLAKANGMLREGCTLLEINNHCFMWREVPKHLMNVTKDNCFVVSHWQCCDKPAYSIVDIDMSGRVKLWGCGSWDGYYGQKVTLDSSCLYNPRPKEELFVDKRYSESIW